MELRKPLDTSAKLTSHPRIAALYDKGSGALMQLEVSTKNAAGEEVLFNQYSLFIRGLGGFGGDKGPAGVDNSPPKGVAPEVVHREKTSDNQALLYRLSGDYNPLHADPELAKNGGGFPAPILHGLCSFGFGARAVIKHFANNDGKRFKSIRVRFVSPVFPGETLVTEMWRVSPTKIVFRTRVAERGIYAVSNACIELHPDPTLAAAAAKNAPAAASKGAQVSTGFEAEKVFAELSKRASPELVKKVNAVFKFDINRDGKSYSWLLDLKNGSGSVGIVDAGTKADCTIAIADADFVKLMAGQLNAQQAFMKGQSLTRDFSANSTF
jgi:acyl dehydratase/putative sterol carrier protein